MTALPFRIFALFLTILVGGVAGCRPDEASVLGGAAPGATGSWSAEAQAGIAAGEYAPQVDGEGFRVTNRAQNLRGSFGERGVTIQRRDGTGEIGLRLTAWGREGAIDEAAPAFPEAGPCLVGGGVDAFGDCLRRVDYARPGLTEWWENRSEGLELGYSVTAPPDGDGALVFELALSGALADVDGDEALLVREVGEPLRLAKLAAWDERGRELPAWMEETEDGLRLVVDDEGAIGVVTVDPLITTAGWTAEGDQGSAAFGYSVASAGDVNGDGYGDVVVGAVYYDNGESDEGRAYLYLGASGGLSAGAAWSAESDQASARFGEAVSSGGDVNGDGYGDVVVGASSYDNGSTDEGRAYVYLGSASGLSAVAAWTAESDQAGAEFGYAVAPAGDVNGDGYGDVMVGARSFDNGETDEGRAYVYLGSSSGLSTSAAWTAESDQASALFGKSVSSAGDVNGDGYGDVVLEAYFYDNGEANEGRAYVYLGSAYGLAASAAWTAESDQTNAYGSSAASAGDVNGDGYGDVLVGTHSYDNGQTDEGRAYMYLGSSSGLSATAAWTAESDQASAYFGHSVASAGDVNGDGYGDVVVGAYGYSNGSLYEGRAYVYLGSGTGLASNAAWTAESDQASAVFGLSVASAGDVNGDGYGDVLVGARNYDNGETDEGRVSVFLGSGSGLGAGEAWSGEGGQDSAIFGTSLASAGDVNGDGYGDVVVGASSYDNGEAYEGRAYLYLGSTLGLATTAAWTAESDQATAFFGTSVASAGDVNGDGYADVVVGASQFDNGETDEGRAFVYLGSASGLEASPAWTGESDQATAYFGSSVASAGDVNGDGYADVVVGAHYHDNGETNEGGAYLYLGSSSGLATSTAWTAESDQASALFGFPVASAGDVNGDGYGDVVVGAFAYDNGESDEGRAYVYLGSASGLSTSAAWTAESDQSDPYFGSSLASAGDVNGDGYGDVVVGAYAYDNGETSEGRAYVYLGSTSGLTASASWTAESDQAGAYFGRGVASAGDVNGDGYGDVVVGAIAYTNGESNEGRAYVYLGSSSGLALTAAWTAEADQDDSQFGWANASAGDVNGDGFGDLIVGARYYTNGSTREGAAFLYLGNGADGTTPLSLASQARQTGTTTPIAPGLASTSETTFDVAMLSARTSFGLGEVKLQVEVKPLGTAFDGTDLTTSATFISSGLTGVEIQEELAVLTGSTGYHWRARVLASPAEGRPQGTGRWVYGGLSGNAQGAHVHTLRGSPFYADTDGDGYGDAASSITSAASSVSGYVTDATDCDDTDANVNPAATETVGDGVDQDCDDVDGCYTDSDGDTYGTAVVTDGSSLSCSTGTGASVSTDCDDTSASIYPGATELTADSIDQDCDGVDSCYTDADGDNYGTTVVTDGSSLSCVTGTGAAVSTDCDDASSSTNPAAAEAAADGIDQDCNSVDSCYTDADGDNYGTTVVTDGSSLDCVTGTGAAASTDCDDTSATIYPGATETTADSIDQDCDGVDSCYTDTDGDDYGTTVVTAGSSLSCVTGTGAAVSTDCDDASASINPGATETIGDGTDQDCTNTEDCYTDADGDGYRSDTTLVSTDTDCSDTGEALATLPTGDCDDSSALFNPAALEPDCADPTDYNCDGLAGSDDADGDGFAACEECNDTDNAVNPDATELPGDTIDQDCDGTELCYADADDDGYRPDDESTVASPDLACDGVGEAAESDPAGDCDDTLAAIFPGTTELPGDETDQDCDGTELCYVDGDADGYTDDGPTTIASEDVLCDASGEATSTTPAGDCDDTNAAYNPGATESDCEDPNDYNCDGATGTSDGDLDGYPACEECDDSTAAVNPDADEVCNELDDDCDGLIDTDAVDAPTWYADADRDGYADLDDSVTACDPPAGYIAATEADCDDFDAPSHPGGDDLPGDGLDQDCDGADAHDGNADDTGEAEKDGCGCSSGGGSFAWSLVCVVAAMALRRKPSTLRMEKP